MNVSKAAHRKVVIRSFFAAVLREYWLFGVLTLVLIGTVLPYANVLPVWDSWVFFRCYQQVPVTGMLQCDGHNSLASVGLFSVSQFVASGNVLSVQVTALLLVIGGLLCLRSVLGKVFYPRISGSEIDLYTFVFGFNPILLAQLLQPSLDLPLAVFSLYFITALFFRKYILAGIFGLLLIFSKETGAVYYGIIISVFGFVAFLRGKSDPHNGGNRIPWWIFTIPPLLLLWYMQIKPPFPHLPSGDTTWLSVMKTVAAARQFDGFFLGQTLVAYVLNFSWIMTAAVLVAGMLRGCTHWIGKTKTEAVRTHEDKRWVMFCFLLLVAETICITRIKFVNNPRYMLPLVPIGVMVFADAWIYLFRNRVVRIATLVVLLAGIYASFYRTIDPVSRAVFGTFTFGNHTLLAMSTFTHPDNGYGKDELVYNAEFMELPFLTEDLIRQLGTEKIYVVHEQFTWTVLDFDDYKYIDKQTGRRKLKGEHAVPINIRTPAQLLTEMPAQAFLILYPNMHNDEPLGKIIGEYALGNTTTVAHNGYTLSAVELFRK